jgi:hypothetical protein
VHREPADRARRAAFTLTGRGGFLASPSDIAARALKLLIEFIMDRRQELPVCIAVALQRGPLLLMTILGLRQRIGSFGASLGQFPRVPRLHLLVLPAMELLRLFPDLAEPLLDGVLGGFSQFRPPFRQGRLIGTPIVFARRVIGSNGLIRDFIPTIVLGNGCFAARSCRRPPFRQGRLIGTPIVFARKVIGGNGLIRDFIPTIVLGNGWFAARSCRRVALCRPLRG